MIIMRVVIDSCVLVSMFSKDIFHHEAEKVLEAIIEGKVKPIVSTLALPEVTGAIKRVTKNEDIAKKVKDEIMSWIDSGLLSVEELTKERMRLSSNAAIDFNLKGADAVHVSLAKELKVKFLTFDEEVKKKIKNKVKLFKATDLMIE